MMKEKLGRKSLEIICNIGFPHLETASFKMSVPHFISKRF